MTFRRRAGLLTECVSQRERTLTSFYHIMSKCIRDYLQDYVILNFHTFLASYNDNDFQKKNKNSR